MKSVVQSGKSKERVLRRQGSDLRPRNIRNRLSLHVSGPYLIYNARDGSDWRVQCSHNGIDCVYQANRFHWHCHSYGRNDGFTNRDCFITSVMTFGCFIEKMLKTSQM